MKRWLQASCINWSNASSEGEQQTYLCVRRSQVMSLPSLDKRVMRQTSGYDESQRTFASSCAPWRLSDERTYSAYNVHNATFSFLFRHALVHWSPWTWGQSSTTVFFSSRAFEWQYSYIPVNNILSALASECCCRSVLGGFSGPQKDQLVPLWWQLMEILVTINNKIRQFTVWNSWLTGCSGSHL